MPTKMEALGEKLREAALAYPEAKEEFPWGDRVVKVKGKIFVFLGLGKDELGLAMKLPVSSGMALGLPFCKPTGYGLGKAGWVSATITAKDKVPAAMLLEWLEESYRAVAPKKLAAALSKK